MSKQKPEEAPRHAERVAGSVCDAAGGGKSEHKAAAAVEKSEEKREAPEGFFGHRKGLSPTAPATKKRGQRPLFFLV